MAECSSSLFEKCGYREAMRGSSQPSDLVKPYWLGKLQWIINPQIIVMISQCLFYYPTANINKLFIRIYKTIIRPNPQYNAGNWIVNQN